jgi:hypothetical protein
MSDRKPINPRPLDDPKTAPDPIPQGGNNGPPPTQKPVPHP